MMRWGGRGEGRNGSTGRTFYVNKLPDIKTHWKCTSQIMFIHSLKYIKKLSTPTFEEGVGLESLVFNFGFLDKYTIAVILIIINFLSTI